MPPLRPQVQVAGSQADEALSEMQAEEAVESYGSQKETRRAKQNDDPG